MKLSAYFHLFSSLFLLFIITTGVIISVEASSEKHQKQRAKALFVFGDSYADTGNLPKILASSWKKPYGSTFPGKPSGRFSNGRVFTDFLARFLGVEKSPVPYRWMKYATNRLQFGTNFAYGGTGVFDTLAPAPNMTTQIDFFENLINSNVYTKKDLDSSFFLFSVNGNDYGSYLVQGGTIEGLPEFMKSVVKQLVSDLKRIESLGGKKIAVTSLPPLGCLPLSTATSAFRQCNVTSNFLASFHNSLLFKSVAELNKVGPASFYFIDFFTTFFNILNPSSTQGTSKFENPLEPCCLGIGMGNSCGSVDENGVAKYKVCDDPSKSFFWDQVHPTQAGWNAVYTSLIKSLYHHHQQVSH